MDVPGMRAARTLASGLGNLYWRGLGRKDDNLPPPIA